MNFRVNLAYSPRKLPFELSSF